MNKLDIFKELQNNYTEMRRNNTKIREYKSLSQLKSLKIKFDSIKKEYNVELNNFNNIKIKIEKLNIEAENKKQENKQLEFSLYNEAQSDLKLIDGLQSKIKINDESINELENEEINLLENEEELNIKIKSMKNEMLKINNKFYKIKKQMIENKTKVQKNLDIIKDKIKELEVKLSSEDIKKFHELLKDKGSAIVELKNEICSGCGIQVSQITLNKMKIKDNIVYCENCGRILYESTEEI